MNRILLIASACMALASCNDSGGPAQAKEVKTDSSGAYSISEKAFGNFEGKEVKEYLLTNPSGMKVGILNYGGTITHIIVPDRNGNPGDVVLGFDSLSGYLQKNNPYFGSLVGRYANRIANAKFSLDGKTFTLAGNDHGNSLHGGNKGFDKVIWTVEKLPGDSSLRLSYLSKDGEEGYPGNLEATVTYTLTAGNALKIDYSAKTDKATPVNLTSHAYFNLSGGADSNILAHRLQIFANKFTPVNASLIPDGRLQPVAGGPMDFLQPKPIGKDLALVKGGFDHNWILDRSGNTLFKAAVVEDSASGRKMEVWTTEPGLQFYSGNFLDGTLSNTRGGKKYPKHAALCLEAQHFPDSPNQPAFPGTILKPGETYHQATVYQFVKE
jgi:aldose 1-epimerase